MLGQPFEGNFRRFITIFILNIFLLGAYLSMTGSDKLFGSLLIMMIIK